jgi:hypothetical protein
MIRTCSDVAVFGPRVVGQPEDSGRFRSSDVKRRQEPSRTGIEPKRISQVNVAVEIECCSWQFVERCVRCNDAGKGAKVQDDEQLLCGQFCTPVISHVREPRWLQHIAAAPYRRGHAIR